MLKWPEKARRSLAIFFVKWNDFDVFVEDTAKYANTLYTSFISKVAGGNCKVAKVIPLGDRKRVVDAAVADTKSGGRRRLYLVDGDLDIIAGIPATAVERLFTHRVYHVENYFVCEDALVHVLNEENPRLTIDEVRTKLGFSDWTVQAKPLLNLFTVFGLTRILDPSLPTIALGIGSFSTNNSIDEAKIQTFCNKRVTDLAARFPAQQFDAAKEQVNAAVAAFPQYTDLISAREFLLPALRWWIKSRGLRLPADKESLLFRLSKACSFDRHTELIEAIRSCATAKTT